MADKFVAIVRYAFLPLFVASLLGGCGRPPAEPPLPPVAPPSNEAPFAPDISAEESLRRHRALVQDDIWWTMTGEQMAWTHKNAQLLFPTAAVHRAGPVRPLPQRPMPALADFPVTTPQGAMPFDVFLHSDQSTALGVVILHQGSIVFERYPRMKDYQKPVYWSVAKVLPATLIRIFEERGEIDVSHPIEAYLPELGASALAGVSVRNILDMASGLDCEDDYEDRNSCYYQYSIAIGDGYRDPADADAPDNPYDYVAALQVARHGPPGERFSYSGLNTFVLAWLVEKLTGHPFQDVLSREIWTKLGAEADAAYIAYRYGIPLTHGGFMARPRDLARFGLLFTPSYRQVSDARIISAAHLEFLRQGANPALRRNLGVALGQTDVQAAPDAATTPIPEGAGPYVHNIYQWDYVHSDGTLYKGGWAGQGLIVNPELDLVAVYASYFKDDYSEVDLTAKVFEALHGVFGVAMPPAELTE